MSSPWYATRKPIKVIESGTIRQIGYDFLLVFYGNFVPDTHRFWDIQLEKCRDLENRVRGPWRSLEMSSFDRAHTTSYSVVVVVVIVVVVVVMVVVVLMCYDVA